MHELKQTLQHEPKVSDELIKKMLQHVGSTDAELRDQLIYSQLATWIATDQLTHTHYKLIIENSLIKATEYLGSVDSDTIFHGLSLFY
ncbi:hypothetical protein [Alkalicoccobacillus murimartini]|uniref:Bacteriocin immunity protein n=1 Tax=Alkalicoccobacillus murimartini TaxID=171685 RepID=A0ABT9YE75_9BACI|nr:hypothetical protein [Alkalicoccobacillus murimartini]MDQ0206135.1 hypothetical protein [Alkalicoccobacillus murimartini]